jgi:hypothetical protein
VTAFLGLDFGTGFTKVARSSAPRSGSGNPVAARMVPTVVTYRGLTAQIPGAWLARWPSETQSREQEPDTTTLRCEGFPGLLDGQASDQVAAFNQRTASEVSQDFLRLLLAEEGLAEQHGESADLVVAVPLAPQTAMADGSAARELAGILAALGWQPHRLVPAPVASLLYMRDRRPDLAAVGRFVMCEAGAGAVTFSLCSFEAGRARIVDVARVTCLSVWSTNTRDTAADDGRPPVLVEGLASAIAEAAVLSGWTGPRLPGTLGWRALQHAFADREQRERLDVALELAIANPRRHGRTRALSLGPADVTAAQLLHACAPLAQACGNVLAGLLRRQPDTDWIPLDDGSGSRLVLSGGLSALRPVRMAMLAAAGLDPAVPTDGAVELDALARMQAAACGAALVAAGHVDPGDRFPHALRLQVRRQMRNQIVPADLTLAAPGDIDLNLAATVFATEPDGSALLVEFPAPDPARPVPVDIVPAGGGPVHAATFCRRPDPPAGSYRIGVRGGPDSVRVILAPAAGGEPLSYALTSKGAEQADGGQ